MKSIHLKAGREKSVRRRHPWIFSGAIDRVDGEPAAGETVLVKSAAGQPVAVENRPAAGGVVAVGWVVMAAGSYRPPRPLRRRVSPFARRGDFGSKFVPPGLRRCIAT